MRPWMFYPGLIAAVCGAVGSTSSAHGQDPEALASAEARELFQAASELSSQGDHAGAVRLYQQSLRISRRAPTAFNLAVAHHEMGNDEVAHQLLVRVQAEHYGAVPEAMADRVEALRRVTQAALVEVVLQLEVGVSLPLEMTVDSRAMTLVEDQRTVFLQSGERRILVQGVGGRAERTVVLQEGRTSTIALSLETEEQPALETEAELPVETRGADLFRGGPAEPAEEGSAALAIVLIGSGVVLAVGAIAVVLVLTTEEETDPVWGRASQLASPLGFEF